MTHPDTTPKPTAAEVAAKIPRFLVTGIVIMFAITLGCCLLAGLDPFVAVGVAALPSFVAGPFVGGMITVAAYRHVEGVE